MKKVMLILMLVVCFAGGVRGYAGSLQMHEAGGLNFWGGHEPEPEIGHTWKENSTGICYDITLVEKDCITASANWSDCLLVSTRKHFLKDYTFVCKPVKPEIAAGQVWKCKFSGDSREIFDVSEKYVVYGYTNGSDRKFPSVKLKEVFCEKYELVEDITLSEDWTGQLYFIEPPEPTKPYLHKNPNNDHWICSKHGDLEPIDLMLYICTTMTFYGTDTYCYECLGETMTKVLNQYITGVKEEVSK